MAETSAGGVVYKTELDVSGLQKGLDKVTGEVGKAGTTAKDIVKGLGISKIITTAISTISASMDDAIKRVDTLNNFPKVMSNLGISTKESSEAIKRLSDGLTGLPTTLDAGALSVQRFTSKNEDVNKSVDLFLALNNAILAGGASSEIQASAIEQISQSYAKGKPDMMEWRSLQTAMPAQLKQISKAMLSNKDALESYLAAARQYAKDNPMSSTAGELIEQLESVKNGTGDMTTALGTGLRTGIISMDDFMDTIVELDKNGGDGIKSFAEQAKNSTDGIETSMKNLKTSVTRGLANIINSIDDGMKKAGLGSINENIQKVSKNIGKLMTNISSKMPSTIRTIKSVAPAILTIVTAKKTFDIALKTREAIMGYKKDLVSLSATLVSNPWAIAVAGVVSLTSALILARKAELENGDAQMKVSQTLDSYNKSMREANNERQKYLDSNMNEIQGYENLWNELQLIVDENGKVKEGYEERAKFISGQLSEALGTEIELTDGQINNYKELRQQVANVIEQKRAQVLLEAEEKKYNEAKDQQIKLQESYTNAYKQHNHAVAERTKYLNELREKYSLTSEQMKQFAETGTYVEENGKTVNMRLSKEYATLNSLDAQYASTKNRLDEIGNTYAQNQNLIGNYERAMQYLADGNYQAVLKMYEDTANYQGKTKEETYSNYQASIDAQRKYLQDLQDNKFGYDEQYLKNEIAKTQGVISNLEQEQAKYKAAIETGQSEAKNAWSTGLSEQINEISNYQSNFKNAAVGSILSYISGIEEKNSDAKKGMDNLAKGVLDKLSEKNSEYIGAGENVVVGFNQGVENKKSLVLNNISVLGGAVLATLQGALDEHSPSKASRKIAHFLMKGFDLGIYDKEDDILKTVNYIGNEVIDKMQAAVNLETGSINAKAMLQSNAMYNSVIQINANFDADLEMDKTKVGRVVAPEITRTIKTGGLR